MAVAYSPKIVTNSLVFHVDAADRRCYSGSGSICRDLSEINGNGTLSNVTYTSDKAFRMNASDSRIKFTRNFQNITNSITLMVAAEIPNFIGGGLLTPNIFSCGNINYGGMYIQLFQNGFDIAVSNYLAEDNGNNYDDLATNLGVNATFPKKKVFALSIGATTAKAYVDGNLIVTSNPRGGGNVNAHNQINIGYDFDDITSTPINFTYLGIKVYKALIYNRVLFDNEVFQNFNAIKGRLSL